MIGTKSVLNRGFWKDDVSQYFSHRHPEVFDAALEQATADGTLDEWTWGMLLGKTPPPGYDQWGERLEDFHSE